ncbi:MAG: NACHT domain-containing protein [Cyanobacteria bacterium P01_A01_bin.37]
MTGSNNSTNHSNGSGNNPNNNSPDSMIWKVLQQYGVPGLFYGLAIKDGLESFTSRWPQILLFVGLGTVFAVLFSEVTRDVFQPLFRRILVALVAKIEQSFIWLTSPFQRDYYRHLIRTHQRYRTQGLDIQVAVKLGLDKMFVPLGVLPEAYDQISPRLIQVAEDSNNQTIWDYLAASVTEFPYRRIALIAPPGAGKTTILEHITLTYAQNAHRHQNRKAPRLIPVLLHLRDVRHDIANNKPDLATLIGRQKDIYRYSPPKGWVQKMLDRGRCLVMLDGLDEVPDEQQRKAISRWIDQQIKTYQQTRFIITSRPLSYQNAGLKEVDAYLRVAPFGLKEIREFLYNWYLQNAIARNLTVGPKKNDKKTRNEAENKTKNLMERIETGGSSSLSELAFNPLLLTMIATVHDYRHDLPLGRAQLYAEIYKVLLIKRYQDRGLYNADVIWKTKQVLQLFALEMMHQGTSTIDLATVSPTIQQQLEQILAEFVSVEHLLKQTDSASGLIVNTGDKTYAFTHQSFQDYLAAVQIEETAQTQLLLTNLDKEWWSEAIHLHAAQFGNATPIVEEAIRQNSLVPLTVANGLVQDGIQIDEVVQQHLEDTLIEGLQDSNPEIFTLAAEVRLANRLRQLHVLNPLTAIDLGYITQAEYQLFLDDQQRVGRFYTPDHWVKPRFQPNDARTPIVGLRAEDARAFCDWLSGKHSSSNPGISYRYRLPMVIEARSHPHVHPQGSQSTVVPWCLQDGRYTLDPEGCVDWAEWKQRLTQSLTDAMEGDRQTACKLTKIPDLVLLRNSPSHHHVSTLDPTIDLKKAISLANDPRLNRAFQLVSSRALNRQPTQPNLKKLERVVQQLRRTLPSSRGLLERRQINPSSLENYRAYLLAVMALWDELAIAHRTLVEQRQSVRWLPKGLSQMSTLPNQQRYQECTIQRDRLMTVYAFFVLLDQRKVVAMPAWEGIRIVQEKN